MIDMYKYSYYYTLRVRARERVVTDLNNKIKEFGRKDCWDKLTLCSIDNKATEYSMV